MLGEAELSEGSGMGAGCLHQLSVPLPRPLTATPGLQVGCLLPGLVQPEPGIMGSPRAEPKRLLAFHCEDWRLETVQRS